MKALHVLTLSMFVSTAALSSDTFLRLDKPGSHDIRGLGFSLQTAADVEIEAVGRSAGYGDDSSVLFWVLDQKTREVVWTMDLEDGGRVWGDRALRELSDEKHLAAGRYEVYVASGHVTKMHHEIHAISDVLRMLGNMVASNNDPHETAKSLEECSIELSASSDVASSAETFQLAETLPGAVMAFGRLGNSRRVRGRFRVDEPMSLRVYAVMEHPRGWQSPVDGGWIVNSRTRERVWSPDRGNTQWAGGGDKNRKYDAEVRFEPGEYTLYFGTDDSHSLDHFNTAPPHDPYAWGVTLLPGANFKPEAFHIIKEDTHRKPLIDLRRAGDSDYLEQPFRVKSDLTLHIVALGESAGGDFADYGWIVEQPSGKTIWKLDETNSVYAGGAIKNRMFDGLVKVTRGDYVALYMTDGSHAYERWNAGAPYDPESWGMAIYSVNDQAEDTGDSSLQLQVEEEQGNEHVLAQIGQVRDDSSIDRSFELREEARVRVYAIGEGSHGEMYDYGTLKNRDTGQLVWEMSWDNTRPAGGARKNRKFDGQLTLQPGSYELHYETDGSHSFGRWNARMPKDPTNWGVSVRRVQ